MIDSGATSDFISSSFVKQHKIPSIKKAIPEVLTVIDGTPIASNQGKIFEHTEDGWLTHMGVHEEQISFNVLDIPKYHIILEKSWLYKHNPTIDWINSSINFPSKQCQKCATTSLPINLSAISQTAFAKEL